MAVNQKLNRNLFIIAGVVALAVVINVLSQKGKATTIQLDGPTFLNKVMTASGGKENYDHIQQINFKKDFRLYEEDGTIEIDRKESHSYNFTKGTSRSVQWSKQGDLYNLIEKDTALYQLKNDVKDTTATRLQLQNKLNAATFVLGLPYTLDADTSFKSYNGIQDFEGSRAHELEVSFKNSTDVWKLYYSLDTLEWLGYWVKTADHYSLVINDEMIEVKGFKLSRRRKSYRTDAQKNKHYLRADYLYSDFKID